VVAALTEHHSRLEPLAARPVCCRYADTTHPAAEETSVRHERPRAVTAAGFAVLAALVLLVSLAGPSATSPLTDAVTVVHAVSAALAAVACFTAARRQPAWRRTWVLFGAACTCWLIGTIAWGIYAFQHDGELPYGSWPDVFSSRSRS
jgi:hypothetical protein